MTGLSVNPPRLDAFLLQADVLDDDGHLLNNIINNNIHTMSRPLTLARLALRPRPMAMPSVARAFSSSPARLAAPSNTPENVDYSKGPSAIDKAAQLFFFTEIVRGEYCAI